MLLPLQRRALNNATHDTGFSAVQPNRNHVGAADDLKRSCCFCPTTLFAALRDMNKKVAIYATAAAIAVAGLSYAAVPLYQIFCQATGYGGTTQQAEEEKFKNMKPVRNLFFAIVSADTFVDWLHMQVPGGRQIIVYFNADTSATMPWKFSPQQRAIKVGMH
jgi:cytochrome c oxidase assembly protein Cox11